MHELFSANPEPVDGPLREVLKAAADPADGWLPLREFVRLALYHPSLGYYTSDRNRVGHEDDADFFTASSFGPLFSELVVESAVALLNAEPADYSFVEIGPEQEGGILRHLEGVPFKDRLTIRPGEHFEIPEKAVVFANEVLDAQPFDRYVRCGDRWCEAGLKLTEAGLCWESRQTALVPDPFPTDAPEGYILDWPSGAHALLQDLASRQWQGLFLTCDYGLDRQTVLTQRAMGTARGYLRHRLQDNFIAHAGNMDITHHVIWDDLADILRSHQFESIELCSQESFFMRRSQSLIGKIVSGMDPDSQRRKRTLMQLLHPEHMGHKFQVLAAAREINL